jgi:RHS repeat-associated protein
MNSGMNLGYTGKPYDTATGMYNYGYRDYQPEVARFTTVDPIRDGANWFAYVNNDPVNWVDMWGLDILAINNRDPTPGADVIIDSQNNDVGHTWASLHEDDGTLKQEYGWGYSSGNPFDGQTLSGALLGNGENGTATSTYTKSITPEEAATIDSLWNDKVNAGTGYNYGGQTLVPNSTFCTEAVIDVLNRSGVLTPEESAIINAPYDQWSNSFPSPLPSDLQKAAALLGNSTAPNPNAFEDRIGQLNAQKAANTSNTASQKGR